MKTRFVTKPLLACLIAVALHTPVVLAQSAHPIDRIAAVVNEDVILRSELDRAIANVRGQYSGREAQLPPADVLERQVLERLVLVKLQVARAQESGIRASDQELEQAVGAIATQNKLSVDQLRQQVVAEGSTFDEFRNSIRDELLIQRLRSNFARSRVSVSEAEIDAAMAAQTTSGSRYRLAHILVGVPEGATPEQIATAQKKIEGVKALIEKGEMDFAAAAVRYSDSQNALEGGDLGWRSLDEIPSAFGTVVRSMKPGDMSAPLRGVSGFQLVKLMEVRDADASDAKMVTQYQARHILIRSEANAGDAQAKAKIDTLAARLKGGADFAQLAREESQDTATKSKGGDLGWFTGDQYGPTFAMQVAALGDNQVSAPFRTEAGWHLIQRLGTRQSNAADQSKRAQVGETIGRRKLEDEWSRYLRELRGEAYVDTRNGKPDATAPAPATDPKAKPAKTKGG